MRNKILIAQFVLVWLLTPLWSSSQNVILAEDFNAGFPSGWVATETDGQTPNPSLPITFTNPWEMVEDDSPSDSSIVTTSYFENTVPAERWLITPAINLAAFGNYLRFKAKSGDASYTDSILVMISTTGNDPSDFQDTLIQYNNIGVFWENFEIDMATEGWVNQTVHLAFKVFSTDAYLLYLDNISVTTEDPLSLDEEDFPTFHLYPQPAKDQLWINFNEPYEIIITDGQGRVLVRQFNVINGTVTTADWPAGIYLIHAQNKLHSMTKRFIVQ